MRRATSGAVLLGAAGFLGWTGFGTGVEPVSLLIGGLLGAGLACWLLATRPDWLGRVEETRREQELGAERRRIVEELRTIETLLRREDGMPACRVERGLGSPSEEGGILPARSGERPAPEPILMKKRSRDQEDRRAA